MVLDAGSVAEAALRAGKGAYGGDVAQAPEHNQQAHLFKERATVSFTE